MDVVDSFGRSLIRLMIRHPKIMIGAAVIAAISGVGSHNAASHVEDHQAPTQAIEQTAPNPAAQNTPAPQPQAAQSQPNPPKQAVNQDKPANAASSGTQSADKPAANDNSKKQRMVEKRKWVVDEPGWVEKVPLGEYIVFSDGRTFKTSDSERAEQHRQFQLKNGVNLTSEIKTDYRDVVHLEKGHWETYQVPAEQ